MELSFSEAPFFKAEFIWLIHISGYISSLSIGSFLPTSNNTLNFEENLSIEVKLLSNKKKAEIDLVELNMEKSETKKISINEKKSTSKKLRILSTNEVKQIKSRIKENKKTNKIIPKKKIKNKVVKKKSEKIKAEKEKRIVDDVCAVIKKCDIEEISKYLIKEGKKKSFPDITIRQ